MEINFLELTPKRKSIIWNYNEDNETASVVVVKSEKLKELGELFKSESPGTKIREEDGIGVYLNKTSTIIWEKCDGITTVNEMIEYISNKYGVSKEEVGEDVKGCLIKCDKLDIIDLNWRSII